MKTTVVIPNYNGIKFIEDCIQALKEDKSARFQVCIVDNGSTDGSLEWIRANCTVAVFISLV